MANDFQPIQIGAYAPSRPLNMYVGAFFKQQDDAGIQWFVSPDGVRLNRLNRAAMLRDSSLSATVGGRDPAPFWDKYRGEWLVPVTSSAAGQYDFTIWHGEHLHEVKQFMRAVMGNKAVAGTVLPGAAVAADMIWAPQLFEDTDDTLYCLIAIRYGADYSNEFGRQGPCLRPFISRCLDRTSTPMKWSAPVQMPIDDAHPVGTTQWVNGAEVRATNALQHQPAPGGASFVGNMGPDLEYARRVSIFEPNTRLIFIPAAKPSAGFANGEWLPGGAALIEAYKRITSFLSANPQRSIRQIIWQGGEADRSNTNFQTQLVALINNLRRDFPRLADVPVSLGQIGPWANTGSVDVNAAIRGAAADTSRTKSVDTDALEHKGDELHFDSRSILRLGALHWIAGRERDARGEAVIVLGQSNAVGWDLAGNAMIDADVIIEGGRYYCLIKDSDKRNQRIYRANSINGPWQYRLTLTSSDSIEAGSWGVHQYKGDDGRLRRKWRVYVDNNRTSNDQLKGVFRYYETLTAPDADYSAIQSADVSHAMRHGSLVNVAMIEDPRALLSAQLSVDAYGGDDGSWFDAEIALSAGNQTIYPQQDFLYVVRNAVAATVAIGANSPANRFYLACLSNAPAAGIAVAGGAYVDPVNVGFIRSSLRLIEMRKAADGRFYPVGITGPDAQFRATKASNQVVTTEATVSFGQVEYDNGGVYAVGSSRLTPPVGIYDVRVSTHTAGTGTMRLWLLKNSTTTVATAIGMAGQTIQLSDRVRMAEGDTLEVKAQADGATIIAGTATFFSGASI